MQGRVRRSWLLVPADNPDRVAETARAGADVVILDLEDTVPPPEKPAARENVKRYLKEHPDVTSQLEREVREAVGLPTDGTISGAGDGDEGEAA